jgi:hypothetical protein
MYLPILYAEKMLDHKHNGLISLQEASKDPTFQITTGKVISTSHLQSANNSSSGAAARLHGNIIRSQPVLSNLAGITEF